MCPLIKDEGVRHPATAMRSARQLDSGHLVYATQVRLRLPRRVIVISQAAFSMSDVTFIGQPLLHHDGRTTLVAKCDGMETLRLMCIPELATYFPPGYRRSCHALGPR